MVASKLASKLMQIRLTVNGVDRMTISFAFEKIFVENSEKCFWGRHEKQVIVKRNEQNSPKTRPMTAMAGDNVMSFVK